MECGIPAAQKNKPLKHLNIQTLKQK